MKSKKYRSLASFIPGKLIECSHAVKLFQISPLIVKLACINQIYQIEINMSFLHSSFSFLTLLFPFPLSLTYVHFSSSLPLLPLSSSLLSPSCFPLCPLSCLLAFLPSDPLSFYPF